MCHEMSQITPTTMLVEANRTAGICQGTANTRAPVRRAVADGERTVTPIPAPPGWRSYVMSPRIPDARRRGCKTSRATRWPCSSDRRHSLGQARLGALVRRRRGNFSDIAEPALTSLVLGDGGLEVARRELRPHARREHELGVGAFPE